MSKAAVRLLLPLAVLLALTACSGSNQEPAGSVSTLASEAPSTENTNAVEPPLPAGGDNPGISVASLPIGLNEDSQGTDVQCVRVNWSGDEFPSGVAVQVTSLDFKSDAYSRADSGCQGPSCTDYVYRSTQDACVLPVRATVASSTGEDTADVTVSMEGRVLCTDPGGDPCTSFAQGADGPPATVTLTLPIAQPAPENTGSGGTETSDSSGG